MVVIPEPRSVNIFNSLIILPKKIISAIVELMLSAWRYLTTSHAAAHVLSPNQIRILRNIRKQRRDVVVIAPQNPPASPIHVMQEYSAKRKNRSSRELSPLQFEEGHLPPELEKLRVEARNLARQAAVVAFEANMKEKIGALHKGGVPKEVAEMVGKINVPIITCLNAVFKNYKPDSAQPNLVEAALKELIDYINQIYEKDLSVIIERAIFHNSTLIADMLCLRTLRMLSQVPYRETADAFAHAVCAHVEGITHADHQAADLISQIRNPDPRNHTPEQIERFRELQAEMEARGEQLFQQSKRFQVFLEEPICHDKVKELAVLEDEDQKLHRKEMFSYLADEVVTLLFPKQIVDQEVIGGLNYVWKQLLWPPEFSEIKDRLKKIIKMILPDEGVTGALKIEEHLYLIIESSVVSYLEEQMKLYLSKLLRKTFDKLTEPRFLKEIVASKIFQEADEALIKEFSLLMIEKHISIFAPLFKVWLQEYLACQTVDEFDATSERHGALLTQRLFEICRGESLRFDMDVGLITTDEFSSVAAPLIKDIQRVLSEYYINAKVINENYLSELQELITPAIRQACQLYLVNDRAAKSDTKKLLKTLIESLNQLEGEPHQVEATRQVLKDRTAIVEKAIEESPEQAGLIIQRLISRVRETLADNQLNQEYLAEQILLYDKSASKRYENTPPFGQMVVNILFKLGEMKIGTEDALFSKFANTFAKGDFFQDILRELFQKQIVKKVHPFRKDYQKGVSLAIEAITSYQDKEKLKDLIEAKADHPKVYEKAEPQFRDVTRKVSLITHDLLTKTMSSKIKFGAIGGKFAKFLNKIIFPTADEIQKIITLATDKLTGDQLINNSLAFRIQEIFMHAAQAAGGVAA